MTLYEYVCLEFDQQVKTLWRDGSFLMDRHDGEFKIKLYALNNFYVEIYHQAATHVIVKVKPFWSVRQLDVYSKLIDISQLFH